MPIIRKYIKLNIIKYMNKTKNQLTNVVRYIGSKKIDLDFFLTFFLFFPNGLTVREESCL